MIVVAWIRVVVEREKQWTDTRFLGMNIAGHRYELLIEVIRKSQSWLPITVLCETVGRSIIYWIWEFYKIFISVGRSKYSFWIT